MVYSISVGTFGVVLWLRSTPRERAWHVVIEWCLAAEGIDNSAFPEDQSEASGGKVGLRLALWK